MLFKSAQHTFAVHLHVKGQQRLLTDQNLSVPSISPSSPLKQLQVQSEQLNIKHLESVKNTGHPLTSIIYFYTSL